MPIMVKLKKSKSKAKLLATACVLVLLVIVLGLGLRALVQWGERRAKGFEDAATAVAVAKGKQECLNEGLKPGICDSIKGYASTAECHGSACWIVYTNAEDLDEYSASMFVKYENGTYVMSGYLRNNLPRP